MWQFIVDDSWLQAYPDAHVGILVIQGATNLPSHPALEQRKQALETELRARFGHLDRPALRSLPTVQAYAAYYKNFKKTYHVQLQLESFLYKGRSLPQVSTLVDAMFMAELANQLLTAGHDRATFQCPLHLQAALGTEKYVTLQGVEKTLKERDMCITDQVGIISSVIYGPDARTCLTPQSEQVLFTVYAPAGISQETILRHLEDIRDNVCSVSPTAQAETVAVY